MLKIHRPTILHLCIAIGVMILVGASWGAYRTLRSASAPTDIAQESTEQKTNGAQPEPAAPAVSIPKPKTTDSTAPTTSITPTQTSAPKTTAPVVSTPKTPSAPTTPPQSPTPAQSPPSGSCTNPYFTTSASNGGITDGGYYVHNNLWNASAYPGTTGTTQVCSYRSWNHTAYAVNNGDGGVKTFPNVHKNLSGRTISSFTTLTSSFASISPNKGIYNVAYDMWLNGIPNDEVMIWTDNFNQYPAGSKFASAVSFSGRSWDVYATGGNGYIAFVPSNAVRITSGTIDIKAMLDYLVAQGRVSASATVDQIGYGVEIVDTGGATANWYVTNFSITHN